MKDENKNTDNDYLRIETESGQDILISIDEAKGLYKLLQVFFFEEEDGQQVQDKCRIFERCAE